MAFSYSANTQNFSYSYDQGQNPSVSFSFSIDHDNYDHVYKEVYDQLGTTMVSIANTTNSTAGMMEDIAATMLLFKANIEQIKLDIIQIQEDIASLEERGKSNRKGIITSSAWWGTDCNNAFSAELPGTIDVQALSTTVTGTNTTFTDLDVDDLLKIDGELYRIKSIESDTELTLRTPVIDNYDGNYTRERDSRYRQTQVISIIENIKECGLYEDFVSEINNPSEV
jgi:hypothetical protein